MARTRKLTHTGSDGSSPGKRVTREGYQWNAVAENVASGYSSASAVVKGWMNSPGHKKNILNSKYKNMGHGKTDRYDTQVFASQWSGSGCTAMSLEQKAAKEEVATTSARAVLSLSNQERAKVGAPAMCLNNALNRAAKKHSDDMARTRKLTHTGSDGSSPGKRVTREGYQWNAVAENVASGYSSASAVVKGWMNSPGHKKNILNSKYKNMGHGKTDRYDTQVFASQWSGSGCNR